MNLKKIGGCQPPFLGLGVISTLLRVGGLLAPFSRWGVVSPLFRVGGLLAHFGDLVVHTSPISFRVCIFQNQKMHVNLINFHSGEQWRERRGIADVVVVHHGQLDHHHSRESKLKVTISWSTLVEGDEQPYRPHQ